MAVDSYSSFPNAHLHFLCCVHIILKYDFDIKLNYLKQYPMYFKKVFAFKNASFLCPFY